MYFKDLEINNFRGIKELKAEDLKDINLFVGKNNSCKTTALEAIFLLVGASNPELILRINNFRDLLFTEQEDLRFIFHNLDYKNIPILLANSYKKGSYRNLEIKPSTSSPSEISSKKSLDAGQTRFSFDTSISEKNINELKLLLSIKEFQKPIKEYQSKLTFDIGQIKFLRPSNYNELLRGVYVSQKIQLAPNMEKKLEDLIINKKLDSIIEILKKVEPSITNIIFGTNQMIFIDIGLNRLIPLNLIGDGIRRILEILLAIYDSQNGIVLIDEIENGLHFSAIKPLWNAIFEATQKFNVQLFATSHNIETLKYLKIAVDESNNVLFANNVRSYTLRKVNKNTIKTYKYDFDKFEFSINQGVEIR